MRIRLGGDHHDRNLTGRPQGADHIETVDTGQAQIDEDQKLAAKVGARGTPNFLINGEQLSGAQPFPTFKMVIEEELNGGFEATLKKEAAKKPAPADKDGK